MDKQEEQLELTLSDLMGGEDRDFVVNAFLALLGRWPDAGGMRNYTEKLRADPNARPAILHELAHCEEARVHGGGRSLPNGSPVPPPPTRVALVTALLRIDVLRRRVVALEEALSVAGAPAIASEVYQADFAGVHYAINALRHEMTDRIDAVLGPADAATQPARSELSLSLAQRITQLVADAVSAEAAKNEARLRSLEARLLRLEGVRPA